MGNGASQSFKLKILEECKKLTNQGRYIEANRIFKIYFPDMGNAIPDKIDNSTSKYFDNY